MPLGVFSQSKIGHVNSRKLLSAMPEMAKANERLDSLQKDYESQLKALIDEYKKLNEGDTSKNEILKKEYKIRIQEAENRIRAFQDNAKTEIEKKSEEWVAPIRNKILKAINEVAKEDKYSIIFDSSYDAILLYVDDNADVTEMVKKKLGL